MTLSAPTLEAGSIPAASTRFSLVCAQAYNWHVHHLQVIIASTRPGRVGLPVGRWFFDFARSHPSFDVELIDLAEVALPFLDEPKHPRLQDYQHAHTKHWSETISRADAYVFVTPEYNYGAPAALVNALDFLYNEWNYKPAAFVSYGGISGGCRSVQMLKGIVSTQKMVPLVEAVTIPFVAKLISEQGFAPTPEVEHSAKDMLDELDKWAAALKPMRK